MIHIATSTAQKSTTRIDRGVQTNSVFRCSMPHPEYRPPHDEELAYPTVRCLGTESDSLVH